MIFIYILFNLILIYISTLVFSKKINPVSVYCYIWLIMMIAYEIKLMEYFELNIITWVVIFSFQTAFCLGCLFGFAKVRKPEAPDNLKLNISNFELPEEKKRIQRVILILSIISAIGIIPNLFILINQYGSNILASSALIYYERMHGVREISLIPYFGTVSHAAVILAGIYISRYGFGPIVLLPIILLILNILPTGGRLDLFYGLLYIGFPIITGEKKLRFKLKHKLLIAIPVIGIIIIFSIISSVRIIDRLPPENMSSFMIKLYEVNPVIHSIYLYLSSPAGVLNAYLLEPGYAFGSHSFGFIYSILNKIGLSIDYERYQEYMAVPMVLNAGSYIREIIEDFSYLGIIFVLLFGFIFGKIYFLNQQHRKVNYEIFLTILYVTTIMSFYMWTFREPSFWITTIAALLAGGYLNSFTSKTIL